MFELFVGVLVGFACGYGIREAISRRRRAVARDRMLKIAEDGIQTRFSRPRQKDGGDKSLGTIKARYGAFPRSLLVPVDLFSRLVRHAADCPIPAGTRVRPPPNNGDCR